MVGAKENVKQLSTEVIKEIYLEFQGFKGAESLR